MQIDTLHGLFYCRQITPEVKHPSLSATNISLVDDSPSIIDFIAETPIDAAYEVVIARDSTTALMRATLSRPEFVILNPGLDTVSKVALRKAYRREHAMLPSVLSNLPWEQYLIENGPLLRTCSLLDVVQHALSYDRHAPQ